MIAYHPHPDVWALMAALLGAYVIAVRVWGPFYAPVGEPAVSRRQVTCFALGVGALWIAADWPVHELAEGYLFSVHMAQHLVLSLVVAPLLLAGLPEWMVRRLIRPRLVRKVMSIVTRPLISLALFNAFIVFSHWPNFVEATARNELLHFFAHVVLIGVSFAMWWQVLSPISEFPRLRRPAGMLYLFAQTFVPTVPASFLTFSTTTFYPVYADAPRVFAGLDALTDQRLAGIVMKLGGGFLLWLVIAVMFFKWISSDEDSRPDPAEWQEFERDLTRARSEAQ